MSNILFYLFIRSSRNYIFIYLDIRKMPSNPALSCQNRQAGNRSHILLLPGRGQRSRFLVYGKDKHRMGVLMGRKQKPPVLCQGKITGHFAAALRKANQGQCAILFHAEGSNMVAEPNGAIEQSPVGMKADG